MKPLTIALLLAASAHPVRAQLDTLDLSQDPRETSFTIRETASFWWHPEADPPTRSSPSTGERRVGRQT